MGLTSGILSLLNPTLELFFVLSVFDRLVANFHHCWDSVWIWCNSLGPMGLDCLFLCFLDSVLTHPLVWVLCAQNLRLNEYYLVMHYVSAAFTTPWEKKWFFLLFLFLFSFLASELQGNHFSSLSTCTWTFFVKISLHLAATN